MEGLFCNIGDNSGCIEGEWAALGTYEVGWPAKAKQKVTCSIGNLDWREQYEVDLILSGREMKIVLKWDLSFQ